MVDRFWFSALMGTLLGFLSGLGTGGGSLLILWLTLVCEVSQSDARCINLLFFIPSAIIAGCCAAAACSWISTIVDTELLKKAFGVLLLATGFRELFYRPRKAK